MAKGFDLEKQLVKGTLDRQELKKFAQLVGRLKDFKLIDWCVYGQPAPDEVCAKFHVGIDQGADFLKQLLDVRDLRIRYDVFPYGIPVIDLLDVTIRLGERRF